MIYHASPSFWILCKQLPQQKQKAASKNRELLKQNPKHPSLHLKKFENYYSVRIYLYYRALCISKDKTVIWFYDTFLNKKALVSKINS